jgi:hypothetical protein
LDSQDCDDPDDAEAQGGHEADADCLGLHGLIMDPEPRRVCGGGSSIRRFSTEPMT